MRTSNESDRYYTENLNEIINSGNKHEVRKIIDSWCDDGLPDDFSENNVRIALNKNSGFVFLTNDNCDCAMFNDKTEKLESWYSTPYGGFEGFLDDLISDFDEMVEEDQDYVRQLCENAGKEDRLPPKPCSYCFEFCHEVDPCLDCAEAVKEAEATNSTDEIAVLDPEDQQILDQITEDLKNK